MPQTIQQKILSTCLISVFSCASYAMPAKPAKCPDAGYISAVGFDKIEQDRQGYWHVARMSNPYDTENSWTFVVGPIKAFNYNDAIFKANNSLRTLQFTNGPIAKEKIDRWVCFYTSKQRYAAFAVTPEYKGQLSLVN